MKFLFAHPHLGAFFLSVFLVDFLTPVVQWAAEKAGVLDKPSPRKVHLESTPLLGGVAIYVAFLLATLSTLEYSQDLVAMLVAATVVLLAGVADDVVGLPAVFKLLLLFFLTFALAQFGIVAHTIPRSFYLPIVVTLFWFAYVASCFNAVDNMNGLCAGLAAIACFFFYAISYDTGQPYVGYLAVTLCGACLGFLRYNLFRAQIFLGDSGAFLIGFLLAGIAVMGNWGTPQEPWKGLLVPVAILFVPLYDLFLTTLLRWRRGVVRSLAQAVQMSAKDHLSHRLVARFGLTHLQAVLFLYLAGALCGLAGLLILYLSAPLTFALVGAAAVFVLWISLLLSKAEVSYPSAKPATR